MRAINFFCVIGVLMCSLTTYGQQKAGAKQQLKQLLVFFGGNWSGTGHFANGKSITAKVSFTASLDSCWMMYNHTDDPPNRYKALAMWGTDAKTNNILAVIFDNFGGRRLFIADSWDGKKLTLVHSGTDTDKKFYHRFCYRVLDKNKFELSYHVSADSVTWRLGDSLIFNRVNRQL